MTANEIVILVVEWKSCPPAATLAFRKMIGDTEVCTAAMNEKYTVALFESDSKASVFCGAQDADAALAVVLKYMAGLAETQEVAQVIAFVDDRLKSEIVAATGCQPLQ